MQKEIVNPWECFAAMVYWSIKVAEVKDVPLEEAMFEYSDLYGSLTNDKWQNRFTSELWKNFSENLKHTTDPKALSDIVYGMYLEQPHSEFVSENINSKELIILEHEVKCGPLMLAFDEYNRERESVRIHYPTSHEKKSWLSSDRFPDLEEAFRKILEYAQENYSEAKYFTSSTWLNQIPNFVRLFPESFNKNMKDIGGSSYLGLWGQFMRSDGSGNADRLNQFIVDLNKLKTFDEAVNAIPMKVLESIGPIEDFYKMYNI